MKRKPFNRRLPPKPRRVAVEQLESRLCLALAYDLEVIAKVGDLGLTSIEPAASINMLGEIAFVGTTETGQGIYVHDGTALKNIDAPAVSQIRTIFPEVQINDSRKVGARTQSSTGHVLTEARIYDASAINSFTNIAVGSVPLLTGDHFDAIAGNLSLTNQGSLAFAGLDTNVWEIHSSGVRVNRSILPTEETSLPTGTFFRLMAAGNNPRIVVGSRNTTGNGPNTCRGGTLHTCRIVVYDTEGYNSRELTLTTANGDWFDLGVRPSISDDGDVVAFYGDLSEQGAEALDLTPGPGIFAAVETGLGVTREFIIQRVAGWSNNGERDPGETYIDANHNASYDPNELDRGQFYSIEEDSRVAVSTALDTAHIVFEAYEAIYVHDSNGEQLSRGAKGVYSTQLYFNPREDEIGISTTGFSKVLEVGDVVDGLTVSSVTIHDAVNYFGDVVLAINSGSQSAIVKAQRQAPEVLTVLTHGFGRATTFPSRLVMVGGVPVIIPSFSAGIPDFMHNWIDLQATFDQIGKEAKTDTGKPISTAAYRASWNSTDGWLQAGFGLIAGVVLRARGLPSLAQMALDGVRVDMLRAAKNAELAAQKIVRDLTSLGYLGATSQTQSQQQRIHLVGHSRGAAVNIRVAQLLVERGHLIDQYTSLDGYSTDWPNPSNSLGDFDIPFVFNEIRNQVSLGVNLRVQEGLDKYLFDFAGPFATVIAGELGIALNELLTPGSMAAVQTALPNWKAPDRRAAGFADNCEVISRVKEYDPDLPAGYKISPSNHLNVTKAYLGSLTNGGRTYILENYLGDHSGIEPIIGHCPQALSGLARAASTSVAPANSTVVISAGFSDGSFEAIGQRKAALETSGVIGDPDGLVDIWARMATHPQLALASLWNSNGDVQLVKNATGYGVDLVETTDTSLSQLIQIPPGTQSVDFDLTLKSGITQQTLDVLLDNEVLGTVSLAAIPSAKSFSFVLPAVREDAGAITFRLNNTGGSARIQLDNLQLSAITTAALPDRAFTLVGQSTLIDALANDRDPESILLATSVSITTPPANGTASVHPTTGKITYTPAAGFEGHDTLTYQVQNAGKTVTVSSPISIYVGRPKIEAITVDLDAQPTASEVHVTFTQPMDPKTVRAAANYQLLKTPGNTPFTIQSASYFEAGQDFRAVLTIPHAELRPGSFELNAAVSRVTNQAGLSIAAITDTLAFNDIEDNQLVEVAFDTTAGGQIEAEIGEATSFGAGVPGRLFGGDLTADGKDDLLILPSNQRLLLYPGKGQAGSFGDPLEIATQTIPLSVVTAHWNNDGRLDLIVSGYSPQTNAPIVEVLLSQGGGVFIAAADTPIISGLRVVGDLIVKDFNNDGSPEILHTTVGWGASSQAELLAKDPFLGYSSRGMLDGFTANHYMGDWNAGDFNRDGRTDIVGLRVFPFPSAPGPMLLYEGTATGFAAAKSIDFFSTHGGAHVEVADFTSDGFLDALIVAGAYSNNQGIHEGDILVLLKGNGLGDFIEQPFISLFTDGAFYRGMSDFNKDGKLDLLFVDDNGFSRLFVPPSELSSRVWLGNGSGGFAPSSNFVHVGTLDQTIPDTVAILDVDGNGFPDALFSSTSTGAVRTIVNNRSGVLVGAPGASLLLGSAKPDGAVALGDLNGDGLRDFVKIDPGIDIFYAQSEGGYRLQANLTTATPPSWVQLEDVNKDGRDDIVFGDQSYTGFGVFLASASGAFTFAAGKLFTPVGNIGGVSALEMADINADGRLDAVATTYAPAGTAVFFGDGTGNFFFNANTTVAGGTDTYAPALIDTDRDGVLDLVRMSSTQISVFRGRGNGTFYPAQHSAKTTANADDSFISGDFNNDGIVDLAGFQIDAGQEIRIYRGLGNGLFTETTPPLIMPTPPAGAAGTIRSVHVAEVNGDGAPDLVIRLKGLQDQLAIALGSSSGQFAAPQIITVGDNPGLGTEPSMVNVLVQSQMLDVGDLSLPAAWSNPLNPLDVNADGSVAPSDALEVINQINAFGSKLLSFIVTTTQPPPPYYDTSADGFIAPNDVVLIVNWINAFGRTTPQGGEGEANPFSPTSSADQAQAASHSRINLDVLDLALLTISEELASGRKKKAAW